MATTGGFTLPGESGHEQLTLALAKRWGADVVRDSDGTTLSDEILREGYEIYSTICIIRDHNEWAKRNMDKLQQAFLITRPLTAVGGPLRIVLMKDYFAGQFTVNDSAMRYWQITDRTMGRVLDAAEWAYADGAVTISQPQLWHRYTASFPAWRVWEEISMYNHVTNHWDKEHLLQLDPIYPEVRQYLLDWMERWCEEHPDSDVVRFTSMFYNFAWFWGADERNRSLFTDWGSYDFTVSPRALDAFEERYGYALCAEDFVNGGRFHVTHMPPTPCQRDWMEFVGEFVVSFGSELVDVIHRHGKKAYVFYDDSWIGVEPYSPRFARFGFDGLIKCVFSGFEARLCAGVDCVQTHELRLHPYLFPVGLGGAPTFALGGDPTADARQYWNSVRRALLRAPIDRIGLGGYLHLVEDFPDFVEYIERIANEFRMLRDIHRAGPPVCLPLRVGVLTAWGSLRSWTCSGHYHENPGNDLINLIESLSGLPLAVEFLGFDEVCTDRLEKLDVLINAGFAGSAWSGGDAWLDTGVVTSLTGWIHGGGIFLGVGMPSAAGESGEHFRMAHVLGVDFDTGARVNHGKWRFAVDPGGLLPEPLDGIRPLPGLFLTDGNAQVLAAEGDCPLATHYPFGGGCGVYLASYRHSPRNARVLLALLLEVAGKPDQPYLPDNLLVECAAFPTAGKLVAINNSDQPQSTVISTPHGERSVKLAAYATAFLQLDT